MKVYVLSEKKVMRDNSYAFLKLYVLHEDDEGQFWRSLLQFCPS